MEIWNDILKFNCSYEQDGEIKDNYNWEGYIKTEYILNLSKNDSAVFSLEGITIDNQVTTKKVFEIGTGNCYVKDFEDKRYLFANSGMNQSKGIIRFVIFSKDNSPIDYEFMYDEEDNCLYGVYYFTNSNKMNFNYNGYAKLIIDQEIDITEYQINCEISNWKYFEKNNNIISNMIEFNKNNLQLHDETNNDRFIKAKKYFRKKDNIKKLTKSK